MGNRTALHFFFLSPEIIMSYNHSFTITNINIYPYELCGVREGGEIEFFFPNCKMRLKTYRVGSKTSLGELYDIIGKD